ncbi:phosphatidate cytidylyltransferase [Vibrio nitrifigilis]|uniref:Phosphatidate cytidylyltransferase n=1 Tax=Vibrio nitrifigilis TaxID=2789781 RepID=A0ABS0GAE7_9VIBR|nr:phosphatidate cytidylyltransferase [Vibrio nitrifigilis]MBF8999385.1 phosphatidate cytidylyltransferase [Vibrio nitrifigilis]
MKQRIITALILAPLVILGIIFLPLAWFIFALAVITLVGFWEWTQFVNSKNRTLAIIPSVIIGLASFAWINPDIDSLNHLTSVHHSFLVVGTLWWIVSSFLTVSYPKSRPWWENSSLLRHLFGILTLLPFYWSVVFLRAESMGVDLYHGAKLVLFVCLIVWSADSGAYFAGKSFGKHKMAPAVSPNKTIEGLLGGLVISVIVGTVFAYLFDLAFTSSVMMYVTILCTAGISVLGDLVESMFKRVSDIKDSSNIIPGHGGILDRIDSLTAAFPVFAFLYFFF